MMGVVLSLLESPVISLPLQLGVTHSELEVQIEERLAFKRRVLKIERLASERKYVLARQSASSAVICCHNANEITTTISTAATSVATGIKSDKTTSGEEQQVGSCKVELNETKEQESEQEQERERHMSREKVLLMLNEDVDDDYDYEQSTSVVNRPIGEVNELTLRDRNCLLQNRVECSLKGDKGVERGALLNGNCSSSGGRSKGSSGSSRLASDQSHALCSGITLSSKDESAVNKTVQNTGKKTKQTLQQHQQRKREQKNKDSRLNAGDFTSAAAAAAADADADTERDADILNAERAAGSSNKTKTKLKPTNATSPSIHQISSNNIINLSDIDENVPHAKHAHFGQHNHANKSTTPITNHLLEKKNHQQQQVKHISQTTSKPKSPSNNKNSQKSSHTLSNNSGLDIMRKPTVKKCALNRVDIEHETPVKQQVHSAHFIDQQSSLITQHQVRHKYQFNTNNTSNNNYNYNRQYKYHTKQHKNRKQHQSAQNHHNQPLANLENEDSKSQQTTTTTTNTTATQFIPTKKFKTHKQFNLNNSTTNNNHLIEDGQKTRDRRSLSTTSSLASSASSSPSSSMLQIYMRDRINGNNINDNISTKCRTHNSTKSTNNNNSHQHHHHQRQQQQQHHQGRKNRIESRDRRQLISSSASSTISSSSSSCDSAQLSPNLFEPEDIVSNLLLHSTANLSIQQQAQSPPNFYPAYIQSEFKNHYQKFNNNNKSHWQLNNNNNICNDDYNFHQVNQTNTANRHAQIFTFRDSPPVRPWLECKPISQLAHDTKSIRQHKVNIREESGQEFTVLSYNVLCDRLVNKEAFPTSPDVALDWFYRRKLIMKQLREFDADIIALQELEIEHYETYFMVELEKHGNYESIFEPKSRAKTMNSEQQKRVDGCAIFYKKDK